MSFIDERKTMRYATKRKVKEEDSSKQKKVKFKGASCNALVWRSATCVLILAAFITHCANPQVQRAT